MVKRKIRNNEEMKSSTPRLARGGASKVQFSLVRKNNYYNKLMYNYNQVKI